MIKKVRTPLLILIIILELIFLNGCWDIREINEIGLVTAVGIDKADEPNKYSVTVQIANPTTDNSSDSNGGAKSEVWIGTEDGDSLFDATRKLAGISSRRIMWAHNNVIIIGESMAKEGIIPIVDYFTHSPELRMKTAVVVAKGDAKQYMTAKAGMENPSGVAFILLEGYRSIIGQSVESHMLQVSRELKDEYSNPIITEISLKKATMQSEGGQSSEKILETIELAGAAVFKKDKMLGWISPNESLGIAWIINQTKDTIVTVLDPEHGHKSVSVETSGVKSKIKSEVIDGLPRVWIHISGNGDIVEEDGQADKSIGEVKENIAELVNKKIKDEIKNSMEVLQNKYMVDCLDFAKIIHVQNNKDWHSGLKDNWEEVFPQIPVTISVDINIRSSTLNQQPMKLY